MAAKLNLPIKEIIHLYNVDIQPANKIADRFHTSVPTILKKLRQNGVTIRDCNKNESRKNHITSAKLNPNIKNIVTIDGKRQGELICPNCGAKRLVPIRSRASKTATLCHDCYLKSIKPPTIEEIKPLYIDKHLTIRKIAKQLHTSHNYIAQILRENGIHVKAGAKPRAYDDTGRVCLICHQHKPLTKFFTWRGAPTSYCKECHNMKCAKDYTKRIDLPPNELYALRLSNSKTANENNRQVKFEVLAHYSGTDHPQCANPFGIHDEITDMDALSLDHINGDGHLDRTKNGRRIGSTELYRRVRRLGYPDGFQVLCGGCQMKKAIVNGEHPRKYHHDPQGAQ